MSDKNTLFWLETAESIARNKYDGQYTLIKLPEGYRFCFGILDHRYDLAQMASGETMVDAIMLGVIHETRAIKRILVNFEPEDHLD